MKVKYKVTGMFRLEKIGTILDAYLIKKDVDGDTVILYHPPIDGDGCYEICRLHPDGYWVSSEDNYINV